jgi:hypothetical protein
VQRIGKHNNRGIVVNVVFYSVRVKWLYGTIELRIVEFRSSKRAVIRELSSAKITEERWERDSWQLQQRLELTEYLEMAAEND